MRSDTKLYEIALNMIHEMYAVAEPPLDFLEYKREVDAQNIKCKERWFEKHRITKEDYDKIISEGKNKYKLTKLEYAKMTMTLLDWSPTFKD